MEKESLHLMMLAAARYASSRSKEDRAAMLAVGSDYWNGFPAFLLKMKLAIQRGRSRDFLQQDDPKHMYALLFVSIMNGLGHEHLDRVGGALLAAASRGPGERSRKLHGAERSTCALAER